MPWQPIFDEHDDSEAGSRARHPTAYLIIEPNPLLVLDTNTGCLRLLTDDEAADRAAGCPTETERHRGAHAPMGHHLAYDGIWCCQYVGTVTRRNIGGIVFDKRDRSFITSGACVGLGVGNLTDGDYLRAAILLAIAIICLIIVGRIT